MNNKTTYLKPEIEIIKIVPEGIIAISSPVNDMDPTPSGPGQKSSSSPFGTFPSYRD